MSRHEGNEPGRTADTLRLYVAGSTRRNRLALENLRRICRENLEGRYSIEVIDLRENPQRAREDQILAVPNLMRMSLPGRRIVGDLSDTERVLVGLELSAVRQ